MPMISEVRKELIASLMLFDVDEDTVWGVASMMDTDELANKMLDWLMENYNATKSEILVKAVVLRHPRKIK